MIRKVVRPEHTNITIDVPTSYIGKDIEFIMFPLENQNQFEKSSLKSLESLRGVFAKYSKSANIEKEKNAWQMHIVEKYNND
ncbi:hypothetical protein ACKGJI_05415 [Sulfurospirillum sp. 1307]|jgi:hypothetical protein